MSQLRLRIELNKGGVGMSMQKLATITAETEKFLRQLVEDIDKGITGTWIATEFDNNSVDYTALFIGHLTERQLKECRTALAVTLNEGLSLDDIQARLRGRLSRSTLMQYAKIAKPIAPDEAVHFGLYNNGSKEPDERQKLTKERSLEIEGRLELSDQVDYEGAIQGTITALFKDADLHCRVRELHSENLISCYFSSDIYNEIYTALKKKDSVVHLAGKITASRTQRKPISMRIKKIKVAEEYLEGDLEKFIGCAPDAAGHLSTEDFIELIRSHE
jgi:hypothetical protein